MRNLARLFVARGLAVSGSDVKDSVYLTELGSLGVRIHVGHDPALLGSPDVVVVSSAIRDDNPEVAAAARSGIPIWKRQQAIGALAAGHRTIAISGAHGKTTTTSLIAATLEAAGLDPTTLIGGDLNESGSGARHGTGDLFVFEADESDGSFLMIPPWVGVITNLDADHLDFYPRSRGDEDAFADPRPGAIRSSRVGTTLRSRVRSRAPVSVPRRMAPRPDAICSCGWTPSARREFEAPCSSTRPRSRFDSGSTGRTTS
jgi:UDP-N-acetylmuramate--alanine ligase